MARVVRLTLIILAAFILGIGFAFIRSINASASTNDSTQAFTVSVGDGPRTIATKLKNDHLLLDERPFYVYVLLTNKRNSFYPGTYDIKSNSTIRQLVSQLTTEQKDKFAVTVIEGWRITDIAQEVAKKTKISADSFLAAAPIDKYEGFLFPDTYYFAADTSAAAMVKAMRDNFDRRTESLAVTNDDVTLASIVEREAKHDEDRPKIAGLYKNRLKINMPLQADPTIQYAKGSWAPITVADYQNVISPYNTYLNQGLPPTPISNPSLKSLQAVKNAEVNEYYYFFNLEDGTTIYSKTIEEHNANKRKYLN
jgi:UPF0755 protein